MSRPSALRLILEDLRTAGIISMVLTAIAALFLSAAFHLDGPFAVDDHSAEWAQAQNLADAINTESARRHLAQKITDRCGKNAAWSELGGNLYQCSDKHGRKTIIAAVQP